MCLYAVVIQEHGYRGPAGWDVFRLDAVVAGCVEQEDGRGIDYGIQQVVEGFALAVPETESCDPALLNFSG